MIPLPRSAALTRRTTASTSSALSAWTATGAPPPPENAVGLELFTIEAGPLQPAEILDFDTLVKVRTVRTGAQGA